MLELSDEEIHALVLDELRDFPLFEERQKIDVKRDDESVYIIYRTEEGNPIRTTHFDLQTIGETCFLVEIELEKSHRGKGLGKKLYQVAENVARNIGCNKINQTASGWTIKEETRIDYLHRNLGYEIAGQDDLTGITEMEKELK